MGKRRAVGFSHIGHVAGVDRGDGRTLCLLPRCAACSVFLLFASDQRTVSFARCILIVSGTVAGACSLLLALLLVYASPLLALTYAENMEGRMRDLQGEHRCCCCCCCAP